MDVSILESKVQDIRFRMDNFTTLETNVNKRFGLME